MLLSYYRRSLIDLFTRVQKVRSNPREHRLDCLAIQEDLLSRIVYVEKRIKSLKSRIRDSKGLLARKRSVILSRAEAHKVKEDIERDREAIGEYRNILYLLKSIGDALAFIYIPKWDIKPMAFKEDAGHVHGKEGLGAELEMLRQVCGLDGAVGILNDLTNSLRYGDVTVVSESGFAAIVEVKGSDRRYRRADRQHAEQEKLVRYLSEGTTEGLYGLNDWKFARLPVVAEEKHHRDQLNTLVGVAYKDGFAFSKVEEGLYYWIVVGGHSGSWEVETGKPGGFSRLLEEFRDKQPILFFANESKFSTQGRYPYTLSIRDPEALFDFYSGWLLVYVIIDTDLMSANFAAHGLKMTFEDDEDVALTITNTDPDKAEDHFGPMLVSRHFFERLAYEFLSLDWFVEETTRHTDISTFTDVEGNIREDAREVLASAPSVRQALLRRTERDKEDAS